jgi:hypothetical protein
MNCEGETVNSSDLAVFAEMSLLSLYGVVDRKHFEHTLNEIKLGMAGVTLEQGILEAGCIENAQGYVFVEYGCLQNQETIMVKLIHCESSEIVWNCIGQGTSPKDTFDEIAEQIKVN